MTNTTINDTFQDVNGNYGTNNWAAFTNKIGSQMKSLTASNINLDIQKLYGKYGTDKQEGHIVKVNGRAYICMNGAWVPYTVGMKTTSGESAYSVGVNSAVGASANPVLVG